MTKKRTPAGKKAAAGRSSAPRRRSTPSRKAKPRAASQKTIDERLLEWAAPLKQEILGGMLILAGLLTLTALAGIPLGQVGSLWRNALRQIAGWGSWVIALSLVVLGMYLALRPLRQRWTVTPLQVIGFEIVFVVSLALTHLNSAADSDAALGLAAAGRGGGYTGWALSVPLVDGLGPLLAWLILALAWLLGAALVFRASYRGVQGWVLELAESLQSWAERIGPAKGQPPVSPRPTQSPLVKQPSRPTPAQRPSQPRANGELPELVIARPAPVARHAHARPSHLPPLDLLDSGVLVEHDEQEIRQRAATIERTLLDFGLPVRVIEVRRGPAVTQYGVAPLYIEKPAANGEVREHKVRVSQIVALTNDLTLALAAPRIRMEAPVPGRPIVGIEVPNRDISLVHLRSVIESDQFHKLKTPLAIGLGLDVSGTPVTGNLATMPHLLIAGTTGSGKSVAINALTTCLVCNNRPEDLRLVMIDPKMVELVRFNGLPHLLGKVEVRLERIIGVLRWLTLEMDGRYKILAAAGARNLADYNRLARRRKQLERLPYIVLLIDELADLMMMAPEEVEQTLVRLAQMARAVGIHLVVATQRPSIDVVTGLIKANFPARIAFAVATSTDSRVILDGGGAESLLGKGDMLFQAPDAAKPVRLQGCFVSDLEIERVVAFWRDQVLAQGAIRDLKAPWEDLLARQAVVKQKDDLLERAIALAQESETISTSFIQRQLRIGYPRAARLMDALAELGIVGGEQAGGRSREVLVDRDSDPLGDYIQGGDEG